jgi:hypothetical protein
MRMPRRPALRGARDWGDTPGPVATTYGTSLMSDLEMARKLEEGLKRWRERRQSLETMIVPGAHHEYRQRDTTMLTEPMDKIIASLRGSAGVVSQWRRQADGQVPAPRGRRGPAHVAQRTKRRRGLHAMGAAESSAMPHSLRPVTSAASRTFGFLSTTRLGHLNAAARGTNGGATRAGQASFPIGRRWSRRSRPFAPRNESNGRSST